MLPGGAGRGAGGRFEFLAEGVAGGVGVQALGVRPLVDPLMDLLALELAVLLQLMEPGQADLDDDLLDDREHQRDDGRLNHDGVLPRPRGLHGPFDRFLQIRIGGDRCGEFGAVHGSLIPRVGGLFPTPDVLAQHLARPVGPLLNSIYPFFPAIAVSISLINSCVF
jgi:hypothetical protein